MNAKSIGTILTAAAVLGLAGCAYPGHGSADYRGYQTRTEQSVRFGVVEAIRVDPHRRARTPAWAPRPAPSWAASRGAPSAAAAARPRRRWPAALLGGIIGSHIEADTNQGNGLEITVLLDGGQYIAVVQEADETFRIGDRVRILSGQGTTRVAH